MKLVNIENAFASPILRYKAGLSEEQNLELLQDIEKIKDSDQGVQVSNQNGWHSKADLFQRKEKAIAQLCNQIKIIVQDATKQLSYKNDYFKNKKIAFVGWMNVNGQGGYNVPHNHPGSFWSGCYYVKLPKKQNEHSRSGLIEFIDPRGCISESSIPNSPYFQEKIIKQPTVGEIFLFPSYLVHWVYPNEECEDRVSIAFNAKFID